MVCWCSRKSGVGVMRMPRTMRHGACIWLPFTVWWLYFGMTLAVFLSVEVPFRSVTIRSLPLCSVSDVEQCRNGMGSGESQLKIFLSLKHHFLGRSLELTGILAIFPQWMSILPKITVISSSHAPFIDPWPKRHVTEPCLVHHPHFRSIAIAKMIYNSEERLMVDVANSTVRKWKRNCVEWVLCANNTTEFQLRTSWMNHKSRKNMNNGDYI